MLMLEQSFQQVYDQTHPNIWAFIAYLQAEEVIVRKQVLKLKAGS